MSIGIERLQSLLKDEHDRELLTLFRQPQAWAAETNLTQGMKILLGHHSVPYFSPLRSAFLFEMRSRESLEGFSPIFARDGGLTLLAFFYENPNPPSEDTLLVVDLSLQSLVPSAWQKQTLLFSRVSTRTPQLRKQKKQMLFVLSGLGERQYPEQQIEKLWQQLLHFFHDQDFEVHLLSVTAPTEQPFLLQDLPIAQHNRILVEIASRAKKKPQVHAWSELLAMNLQDWTFQDLNHFSFFYSDSAISHSLYSAGAASLSEKQLPNPAEIVIPVSFHHELQLWSFPTDEINQTSGTLIERALADFRANASLAAEQSNYRPLKINFQNKICSRSFEDFSFDLVSKNNPWL